MQRFFFNLAFQDITFFKVHIVKIVIFLSCYYVFQKSFDLLHNTDMIMIHRLTNWQYDAFGKPIQQHVRALDTRAYRMHYQSTDVSNMVDVTFVTFSPLCTLAMIKRNI